MSNTIIRVPSYRRHKPSGQAVVTVAGREVYLGRHGTVASKQAYARVIAEFMAASGRPAPSTSPSSDLSVAEVIAAYWRWASGYYVKGGKASSELPCIKSAMRHLKTLYGDTTAAAFGPLALKAVRETMVKAGLSRGVINGYVDRIKRMFKWAAAQELVPGGTYHALAAVDPLRKGRSEARETEPVRPVPEAWVHRTMEYMPPTVAAMTELAMLTGMRPGEVCILRPCDLDMRGKVWIYTPPTHKSEHFGHRRVVPIGPRGQEILAPFLARATDAFCFSPAEVQAHRSALKRAARKTPVQPSQQNRRKARPTRTPGVRYDANSYRNAIEYAIAAANRAAKRKAEAEGREATENELVPHWHPHQLRHTAATIIRREMGLDAARALLGHRSLGITDTYAELDQALAVEAARKLG